MTAPPVEAARAFDVSVGSSIRPAQGESVSGDSVYELDWERGKLVAIVDGLGHGPRAAVAGHAFFRAVEPHTGAPLADLLHEAHRALTKTRGAVASVARFDSERGEVEIASIGNITTLVCRGSGRPTHAVSVAGVLGSAFRRVRSETFALAPMDFVLMHSDGVRGSLDVSKLTAKEPVALAREVIATWSKHNDDAACVVARTVLPGVAAAEPSPLGARTIPVKLASDAASAATEARAFAAAIGLSPRATWEVSIAVSELATNVLKFAGSGTLCLARVSSPRDALELVMTDHGTGIADVAAARVDGYSEGALLGGERVRRPGQGLGVGFGSIHRMMDTVEVHSSAGAGTRIRALKYR